MGYGFTENLHVGHSIVRLYCGEAVLLDMLSHNCIGTHHRSFSDYCYHVYILCQIMQYRVYVLLELGKLNLIYFLTMVRVLLTITKLHPTYADSL
jgi:hypothetical protein